MDADSTGRSNINAKIKTNYEIVGTIAGLVGTIIAIIALAVTVTSILWGASQPDVVVIKEWNLREAPSNSATIKAKLPISTTLSIIGQAEGGYWLYVRSDASGQEGWIANRTDGVSVNVNPSSISLVNTPTPKLTISLAEIISSPTPTVMPTFTSTPTPSDTPSPTSTVPPTFTSTSIPIITTTVIITPEPTATSTFTPIPPTKTPVPSTITPTPTVIPTPTSSIKYPSPTLTDPDNGVGTQGTFPPLYWKWDGQLAEDEFFEVRVWHEELPYPVALAWVKQPQFDYNISGERVGKYFWTVVIVKDKKENVRFKDWYKPEQWPYPVYEHKPDIPTDTIQIISLEPEPRFFFFTPDPGHSGGGGASNSIPPACSDPGGC